MKTMALPDSFLQDLHSRNPATDVISSYVNLKRAGRNMVGLCPFHNEKTPSFTVYGSTDSFYCFGCGAGGDVITFIRRIENLDYMEAVKLLAQRSGLQMPEDGYDDSLSRLRTRIFEANRAAAKFFHKVLYTPEGSVGLEYLRSRGLSEASIKHFGLGFAPKNTYALNKYLSALMDNFVNYTPSMKEIHHIHKLDHPSGTAITLAEGLIDKVARIDAWTEDENAPSSSLSIGHEREGEVPGTHIISWDSDVDTITIEHRAKSREGFALGAVVAAEWVKGRKGFLTMEQLMQGLIKDSHLLDIK